MGVDDRVREVDKVASQAVVSLARMTQDELMLAQQLCDHFELQLGTLVRRADAIRLLGDTETTTQRLQEAAQHLIYR